MGQKTDYDYEIRIYDDCSTDGTSDICREYAARYPEKIKLNVQKENTFLKPYSEMQSYKAIQEIDTKYWCMIDGDDCWCDENKIQIALDCLENHPEYIGFAHDTNHINLFTGQKSSYVHSRWNDFENPIFKKATPYFLTSSRVFRNCGFKDRHIIPVDYLVYFYHAAKGPIFYYDKAMANYYVSHYNNFSNMDNHEHISLLTTFGYKVAKFFDYKEDVLAMGVQEYYNRKSLMALKLCKKVFGVRLGWNIWYFVKFVPRYGFECLDLNWVCPRKLIKSRADARAIEEVKRLKRVQRTLLKKVRSAKLMILVLKLGIPKLHERFLAKQNRRMEKIRMLESKVMRIKRTIALTRKDEYENQQQERNAGNEV